MSAIKTVLIVDDEQETVDIMQSQLAKRGYHTIAAYNGMDALIQLNDHSVDLILLDIKMPQLDGLQLFKKILSKDGKPKFPVLFISAYEEFRSQVVNDPGVVGFIKKPFTIEDLLEEIEKILGENEP